MNTEHESQDNLLKREGGKTNKSKHHLYITDIQ